MKKALKTFAFMVVILPALLGCGGRIRYPKYYTLNLPPAPDPPAQENVRTSIAVREFQSPSYLRQGPIVYRATPEQLAMTRPLALIEGDLTIPLPRLLPPMELKV